MLPLRGEAALIALDNYLSGLMAASLSLAGGGSAQYTTPAHTSERNQIAHSRDGPRAYSCHALIT